MFLVPWLDWGINILDFWKKRFFWLKCDSHDFWRFQLPEYVIFCSTGIFKLRLRTTQIQNFAKIWFWVVLSGSLKMLVLQKMTFSVTETAKNHENHTLAKKNRFFQKSKILTLEWILTKYIAIISEALQVVLICFLVPTNMSLRFLFLWLSWGIDISDFKKIDFLTHGRFSEFLAISPPENDIFCSRDNMKIPLEKAQNVNFEKN